MNEWDDIEIDRAPEEVSKSRRPLWPFWLAGALVVIAMGFYLYTSYEKWRATPGSSEGVEKAALPQPVEAAASEGETAPAIELPPLAESDAWVRELVGELTSHAKLASWLLNGDLIRRYTVVVDNIADGVSPRAHLASLVPSGDFRVVERSGRFYIDPSSYDRYNLVADVFDSLDAQGSAKLYRTLKPLIQEAYRELGHPDGNFDDTLSRAMDRIQSVPVIEGEVELTLRITTYQFADPRLEDLGPVEKHFLRMGSRNLRKIQVKLRELAQALGMA